MDTSKDLKIFNVESYTDSSSILTEVPPTVSLNKKVFMKKNTKYINNLQFV